MTCEPPDQNAWQLLAHARQLTEPTLRKAVTRLPEPVRTVAGYHFGWQDQAGHPADGDWGKGVRGALVLASAQAMGTAPERAVGAAAGVELIHNFTLLHDDFMDRDAVRRSRPAAWSLFGDAQAVLTGDALLVVAMEELAEHPAMVHELCDVLVTLVAGQSADLAFEQRTDVGLDECLEMAADKTAALFSGACALGGLVASATARQTSTLRRFGHHLGLTFQLIDDLLGIWGHSSVAGKPVGSDLRRHKKSLPVVAALSAKGPEARRLAELYHRDAQPLTENEIREAARLIEQAGARTWAEHEAARHRSAALTALAAAAPGPEGARALASLAEIVTHRQH